MTLSSFAADFVGLVRNLYSTDEFVPLHAPRFLGSEQDNVIEAIQSTFVSTVGKQVEEFEQRICRVFVRFHESSHRLFSDSNNYFSKTLKNNIYR